MKTYIFPVFLAIILSTVLLYNNNNSNKQSKKLISKNSTTKKENKNQLKPNKSLITNNTIGNKVAEINKKETLAVNNTEVKTIKKVRKPFIRKSFTYEAIKNNKGIIGNMSGAGKDNPVDNVFHFNITNRYSKRSIAHIEYELYGVKDQNSVTKGINNNYSYGGVIVEKDTVWSTQKEEINLADLQIGHNVIRFSVSDEAPYGYRIKNIKLIVDNKNLSPSKQLIINQPNTATFHKQYGYLCGYVKGEGADKAKIYINGKETKNNNGSFEALTKSSTINPTELKVEVLAVFEDGSSLRDSVSFNKVADYDFVRNGIISNQTQETKLRRNENIDISFKGLSLKGQKNSIKKNTTITTSTLRSIDMPVMGSGLVNVTGQSKGYRLLPHGSTFAKNLRIGIPYDSTALPTGYRPQDIRTYYFNENNNRWAELPYDTVDEQLCIVYSYTNHFTDFINGILKVPDAPQTAAYTPTSLKEMKAANPVAGINMMKPPSANNNGTASTGIAIEIPAGRNGMQPNLSINYSSEGGNGWMGVGWNLTIPSIDVETRWGVPRYDTILETESYLMSGSQLTPMVQRESFKSRSGGRKQFYERIKGSYSKVMRYGTTPNTYFWVVTDRNGTKYYYGVYSNPTVVDSNLVVDTNLVLGNKNNGSIGSWKLAEVRDLHGNFVKYSYQKVFNSGVTGGSTGRQIYPLEITYSGNGTTEGFYKVEFDIVGHSGLYQRADKVISARIGFKKVTANLLHKIKISYKNQFYREYRVLYKEGSFSKTLICSLVEITDSTARDQTTFNIDDVCSNSDIATNLAGIRVHSFAYENQDNASFSPAQTIANPYDDGILSILYNAVTVPDEYTLGHTNTTGWNIGGGLDIGLGQLTILKNTSLGGSYTYSQNTSISKMIFMDIDGDGLNDKVFYKESDKTYRYRKAKYNGNNIEFDSKTIILNGLPLLGRTTSSSNDFGLEGHLGPANISANASYKRTWTKNYTDAYFTDVNADGLPDFIDNVDVYINKLNSSGDSYFTKDNRDTLFVDGSSCNYILRTGAVDEDIYTPPNEIPVVYSRDAVMMWIVPYDGDIIIEAPIQLIEDTSYNRRVSRNTDGIGWSIQLNDDIIFEDTINNDDYSQKIIIKTVNEVVAGQKIFFRLESGKTRQFDKVKWSPKIYYLDGSAPDTNMIDPDGKRQQLFTHSDDLVAYDRQSFKAPFQGQIKLRGTIQASALSDTIKFRILKNSTIIESVDFIDNTSLNHYFNKDISVLEGDEIRILAQTNTNVDFSAIEHDIRLFYYHSDSIAIDTNSQTQKIEIRPMVEYNIYQKELSRSVEFNPQNAGSYSFTPNIIGVSNTFNGSIIFAIKKQNDIIAKKTLSVTLGNVSSQSITLNLAAGEIVFCEYFADSLEVNAGAVFDVYYSYEGSANITHLAGMHIAMPDTMWKFGNLYRGWGQFSYKGTAFVKDQMLFTAIDQSSLCLPATSRNTNLITFDTTTSAFSNAINIKASLSSNGHNDPLGDDFSMMFFNLDSNVWSDFAQYSYIGKKIVSNTHNINKTDKEYDSPFHTSFMNNGKEVRTIRKHSTEDNTSWGYNISAKIGNAGSSVGIAHNSGISLGGTDYFDLNGDKYPDIIGNTSVQYTAPNGSLFDLMKTPYNYSGFQETTFSGIGASAGVSLPRVSGAKTDDNVPSTSEQTQASVVIEEGDSKTGIGAKGFKSESQGSLALFDINGDGLLDLFSTSTNNVYLNLGYDFANAENWNIIDINKGISYAVGISLGISNPTKEFAKLDYSWSGGINVGTSINNGALIINDINGDGLQDVAYLDGDYLYVYFNNGAGFASSSTNLGDSVGIQHSNSITASGYLAGTLGFTWALPKYVLT